MNKMNELCEMELTGRYEEKLSALKAEISAADEDQDYSLRGMPEDFQVDTIPHQQDIHLKLQIDRFVVTSLGLIIQKKQ